MGNLSLEQKVFCDSNTLTRLDLKRFFKQDLWTKTISIMFFSFAECLRQRWTQSSSLKNKWINYFLICSYLTPDYIFFFLLFWTKRVVIFHNIISFYYSFSYYICSQISWVSHQLFSMFTSIFPLTFDIHNTLRY